MSRDYKHAEVFSPGTRPMPLWMWLFAAVAISAFVGLIYYLDQYERAKAIAQHVDGKQAKTTLPKDAQEDPAGENKSRFDFYKLLPKLSVDVDKPESQNNSAQKSTTSPSDLQTEPAAPLFSYILQAGSFKDFHEADRLKANLALMGIQANIEKVTLNQSEVWHRVRIGPIASEREMNKIRSRLRSENIEPIMLKVKS
ncbi:SPOR domain-containing protein [Kaarinaea lacus]